MSQPQRSTEIRFKGTVAFQDPQAAQRLVNLVTGMLDTSMEVFWRAKGDPNYAPTLSKDLKDLEDLCWNFVQSAKTQKTQDRQKDHYEAMQGHVKAACTTLGEYQSGQDWTLGQTERLEQAFKGVYLGLQNMMNESESEVATSLARNCGMLVTAATDMRDKQETHTWESLIHNVDEVAPVVIRSLKNRVSVTQDGEDKVMLQGAVDEIEQETPKMRTACHEARSQGGSTIESKRACNVVIRAAQRAQDVLARHIIGDAMYAHHGIEPEKFADTLDDLVNSIANGDASGTRGAANDLADRVRDMEKRKALEAASQALKDQTKELLAASAEALKNKDSEDAKNRLGALVSAMKNNVSDLAKQEEEANRRKQMLLRAAGGLGKAVDGMANAANSFRDGRAAPTGPTAAEEDAEERQKDERLAARREAEAKSKSPDQDLDDLLAGLDNL